MNLIEYLIYGMGFGRFYHPIKTFFVGKDTIHSRYSPKEWQARKKLIESIMYLWAKEKNAITFKRWSDEEGSYASSYVDTDKLTKGLCVKRHSLEGEMRIQVCVAFLAPEGIIELAESAGNEFAANFVSLMQLEEIVVNSLHRKDNFLLHDYGVFFHLASVKLGLPPSGLQLPLTFKRGEPWWATEALYAAACLALPNEHLEKSKNKYSKTKESRAIWAIRHDRRV